MKCKSSSCYDYEESHVQTWIVFDLILSSIAVFFRQNLLCDVTIVVDTTEIPAHKVVLSSCSQYFYAMFTGDLAEAKSDRITLQEIDPKALIQLIDFVYTSEIHVTEENVQVSYYFVQGP